MLTHPLITKLLRTSVKRTQVALRSIEIQIDVLVVSFRNNSGLLYYSGTIQTLLTRFAHQPSTIGLSDINHNFVSLLYAATHALPLLPHIEHSFTSFICTQSLVTLQSMRSGGSPAMQALVARERAMFVITIRNSRCHTHFNTLRRLYTSVTQKAFKLNCG